MGVKSFLIKKVLKSKMKGVSDEQIDNIVESLEKNPELANKLKALQDNKEVQALLEKIQKEIEEKVKSGMNDTMAQMTVMMKYKDQMIKHQEALMPLMEIMGGLGGIQNIQK
jgi:cell fate (sporulation/competence/biofilm development) regulator YlbF (YheA/YmcA/DUF963 family)